MEQLQNYSFYKFQSHSYNDIYDVQHHFYYNILAQNHITIFTNIILAQSHISFTLFSIIILAQGHVSITIFTNNVHIAVTIFTNIILTQGHISFALFSIIILAQDNVSVTIFTNKILAQSHVSVTIFTNNCSGTRPCFHYYLY